MRPRRTSGALVAYRSDRPESRRFTYAEFGDKVSCAAASLKRMGLGHGDIVSVQLPNWWEFAVIALAAFRVGAVVNPLMPIFRERELSYMLEFAEAKLVVVPKIFRGFDHEAMAKALQRDLPKLAHVVVVDGAGPDSFEATLLSSQERLPPPPIGEIGATPADEMAVLMFTSGTTGSPKGVMHCLNTLMACNVALAGRFGLDESDTMLVCSPLGHMTGFAAGMLLGLKIGATVIFQDIWDPKRGVSIMAEDGVTYSAARRDFPVRYVRGGRRRNAETGASTEVLVLRRAYTARFDRTRLSRARSQGLLALGHDRILVEHAYRA